jgi:histidinol-phosphatase
MDDHKLDLDHALQLADVADNVTMRVYRTSDLKVTTKPDNTPVTKADLEVEKQLSEIVNEQFGDAFIGEEGTRIGEGNRIWMVDPVDGTKNFLRGMPVWGTLISLSENGETIAACVSAPALGRRWWAAKGLGAWTKDVDGTVRRLHVSGVENLSDAFVMTGTLHRWENSPIGLDRVLQLIKSAWRFRAPGDFFGHMLIAEGAGDIAIETGSKAWDVAAPALIIQEAGGTFWTDATQETEPHAPRLVIATNGKLEAAVRQALNT